MHKILKRIARAVVPRSLLDPVVERFFRVRWSGDYPDWTAAIRDIEGYGSAEIFEATLGAARAVRDGKAAWERDSVRFQHEDCNHLLVEALRRAAADREGVVLVDFGGALGSAWWQNRRWLDDLEIARWCVVEQAPLVEVGRREFEIGPLRFYGSLAECCQAERPTVILLSSVLQYLECPHDLLREISGYSFSKVVLDRTTFSLMGRDWLTIQRVPRAIYRASYPCWFFEHSRLLAALGSEWRVLNEWKNEEQIPAGTEMRGMLLERTQ